MAVTLPDIPTEVGESWTNPETGIVYEWNGKRWVTNYDNEVVQDFAHLSKTQTFTGINTFKDYIVLGGGSGKQTIVTKKNNIGTLAYDTADESGRRMAWGTNKNWFYAPNNDFKGTLTIFGNESDNSHRFYIKDKDKNTNLTIFPTGNVSSNGSVTFSTSDKSSFSGRHAYIKTTAPDGWTDADRTIWFVC